MKALWIHRLFLITVHLQPQHLLKPFDERELELIIGTMYMIYYPPKGTVTHLLSPQVA